MKVRPYLQLTRAHTAPLEIVPAIVAARLVTGSFLNWEVAVWGFFGLLYHLTGYGMNSLSDWELGHDKDDPNKQHHPLNTGELSLFDARITIMTLVLATIAWLVIYVRPTLTSASLIALMVGSGVAYNFLGKTTLLKPIPISIAHSMVFLIPYYSISGRIDQLALLGTSYVFLWVMFQIGISGELKDLMQDDENLLRTLGVDVGLDGLHSSLRAYLASNILRSGVLVVAIILSVEVSDSRSIFFLTLTVVGAAHVLSNLMIEEGRFNRDKRVMLMSFIELLTAAGMVIAVTRPADGLISAVIIGVSIIWVLALNRIEWGTWIAPSV